jgi:outer membrane protein assembly factor BamB
MKLQVLRDDGATEQQLAEARERLKPVGEVWSVDLATRNVDWKFSTTDAILGAIAIDDKGVHFGSRDGWFYRLTRSGELFAKYDLHEPIVAAPGVGKTHVYCSTVSGRLFCLNKDSLKPAWDTSLGAGEMFVSSPTIAHGHVYIGSAESGLLCLGHPGEPEPELWTKGERGGCTDNTPLSDASEVVWQYPDEGSSFRVTAPLMPFDSAIFAAGITNDKHRLIRLNVSNPERLYEDWSIDLTGTIEAPLVGCTDRVLVIERSANPDKTQLQCLAANDGSQLWSQPCFRLKSTTGNEPLTGITGDRNHVFAWSGPAELACFDLKSGAEVWNESPQIKSPLDSPRPEPRVRGHGIGSPVSTGDILFAALALDDNSSHHTILLRALDAWTGTPLWEVKLNERPIGSPEIHDHVIRLPVIDRTAVYRIVDGTLVEYKSQTNPINLPSIPEGVGNSIVPPVAQKGFAYIATDQGKIVCLGAKRP